MLKVLDSTKEAFGSIVDGQHEKPLRTSHNGKIGSTYDSLIYIKNDDPTLYYVDVAVKPVSTIYDDIVGEWGETGFGLKLLYGERQPTETEWDQVKSGETIDLPDIGSELSADTANYYPVWVRAIVPGMTTAQIKKNISVHILSHTREVGT